MAVTRNIETLRTGVVTSSTRPSVPYVGQVIYETDTLLFLAWNGTAWTAPALGGATVALNPTNNVALNSRTGYLLVSSQLVNVASTATLTTSSTTYGTITIINAKIGDILEVDAQVDFNGITADSCIAQVYVNGTSIGDTFVSVPVGRLTVPVVRRYVLIAAGTQTIDLRCNRYFSGNVQIIANNSLMRISLYATI